MLVFVAGAFVTDRSVGCNASSLILIALRNAEDINMSGIYVGVGMSY
jgi:hypothetical protein